jgi:hypothetical protein
MNDAYKTSLSITTAGTTAATGILECAVGRKRGGGIQLTGTFVGTVQFEETLDSGTTWIAKTVYPAGGGVGVTSAAATGQWKFACGGSTNFRVRCSAFTSGPIVVDLTLTEGVDPIAGSGAATGGSGAATEYETVAAGQTAQVLGATGATGDYLSHVILQPAALTAGTTTILDNATVIYTYTAGTLSDLRPITIPVGAFSVSGAWKITTGANMAALAIGNFT